MHFPAQGNQPEVNVRKLVLSVEDVWHDGGRRLDEPLKRGWVAAVIANPYAGRYVEDIQPFMEALKPLGLAMADRLLAAIGGPAVVQSYGKGGLVGSAGEIEHGHLWHLPGGYCMRDRMEGSHAIVPSATKLGPMGTSIDIPLHHRVAAYVRSHFDGVVVCVPDAPRADEIVFIQAMATGPRPHARVGGLEASGISKFDGNR